VELFWKRSIKNLSLKCYTSIDDLPIKTWFEIHKTANFLLLLREPVKITNDIYDEILGFWEEMYNQYINKFGLSDEFIVDLRSQMRVAEMRADYIITGQRHFLTLIKIEEEKERLHNLDVKEPQDLEIILAKISKYYGFKLSSKELTVTEYYSYLHSIGNGKAS